MRIYPDFEESVAMFGRAISTAQEDYRLLDTVGSCLHEVAGDGPYGAKPIHALAVALAEQPNDRLYRLAHEAKDLLRSLGQQAERSAEALLEILRQDKPRTSTPITGTTDIDHTGYQPTFLWRHFASLEAIVCAIHWVHDPPSKEEQSRMTPVICY